jgi:hypothetical protein
VNPTLVRALVPGHIEVTVAPCHCVSLSNAGDNPVSSRFPLPMDRNARLSVLHTLRKVVNGVVYREHIARYQQCRVASVHDRTIEARQPMSWSVESRNPLRRPRISMPVPPIMRTVTARIVTSETPRASMPTPLQF